MIVKNEAANLKRCLDSFLPIIHEKWSELIIVDTGSKDQTVKIAKEYTKKVIQKRFVPWNFSKARNFGIKQATGERILVIDADEELRQDSLYLLEHVLLCPTITEPTIFVKLFNYYTKDRTQYSETVQSRIFNNDDFFHYESHVHNKPMVKDPYMFATNIVFNHYGYMFEGKADLLQAKKKRGLPVLEAAYMKNPDDMHISTHLIKTYNLVGNSDKVIELGERWIKSMRKVDYNEGWFAFLEPFICITGAYVVKGDMKNAVRVAKEAEKYSNKLLALDIMIGNYYTNKNKKKAVKCFEKVLLHARKTEGVYEHLLTSNVNMVVPELMNYMAIEFFSQGDYKKAGDYINTGIRLNQNRLPLRWDIFNEVTAKQRLIRNGS